MRSSYSGSVIGPKMSTCTLPRMFMPAPWITRTLGIALSLQKRLQDRRGRAGHPAHRYGDCGSAVGAASRASPARAAERPLGVGTQVGRARVVGGATYRIEHTATPQGLHIVEQQREDAAGPADVRRHRDSGRAHDASMPAGSSHAADRKSTRLNSSHLVISYA